jgi:hypothetical protein
LAVPTGHGVLAPPAQSVAALTGQEVVASSAQSVATLAS